MKMQYYFLFILFLSGMLLADFNPPQWRGLPGSTYQMWTFSTSDTSPIADNINNLYGTPQVNDIVNGTWYNQFGGLQGVWAAQTISFYVPGSDVLEQTICQIRVKWHTTGTAGTDLDFYISNGYSPVVSAEIIDNQNALEGNAYWQYSTFEAILPSSDSVTVNYQARWQHNSQITSIAINEITIDTMTVPEPTTMLLLGFGGLLIRRK